MRHLAAVACLAPLLLATHSLAAPGYQWEMKMEMQGMPFPMPPQKVCTPKTSNEPPVTRDDGECKILEKKQTGNRFQWTAQCKDGLMTGDITSTPTSYDGSMKMTDKSGKTVNMKMAGKRLGDCDYQDRTGEIKAMQKHSKESTGKSCQDGPDKVAGGVVVSGSCPKEKPAGAERQPAARPVEESKPAGTLPGIPDIPATPADVQQGVKKLKGLFGI